jgi:lipopolysaccharide export system protein LptA
MKVLKMAVTFVVVFGIGLGILLLLTDPNELPDRRGLRIEAVAVDPEERGLITVVPLEGLPNLLAAEAPEVTRFERVTFPDHDGVYEVLAWHLRFRGLDMEKQQALGPVFTLYPRPESPAEAASFQDALPKRVVEIRADSAAVTRRVMPSPTGEGMVEDQWELDLLENVAISSQRGEQEIELLADDLRCLARDRRISSKGRVAISADTYEIKGVGLSGDAELGTFSVTRNVEVSLPTAALLGDQTPNQDSTTTVSCAGPLLVERLGSDREDQPELTRVRFLNDTRVAQTAAPGQPDDELTTRELTLMLLVRKIGEQAPAEVTVQSVKARGDVHLKRGGESEVRARELRLTRLDPGEKVEMDGPLSLRHRGMLRMGTADAEAGEALVKIEATKSATLIRGGPEDPVEASFLGAVTAVRETPEGTSLLQLRADSLKIRSLPGGGETMSAEGNSSFTTPTASGRADRILWTREADGREHITLSGAPHVTVRGGAGFNPFGAPQKNEKTEDPGRLDIRCEEPMSLSISSEERKLALAGRVRIAKIVGSEEVLFLEADRVDARFTGEVLDELIAEGSVTAAGRGEAKDSGRTVASGDRIRYSKVEGQATLTGSPAMVRLTENARQTSEITALSLVFHTIENTFLAENDVNALVFLAAAKREKIWPYTLSCTRLTVVPGEAGEDKNAGAGALKVGRISSLTAEGPVVLTGRDRVARGSKLLYDGEGSQQITLTGDPAVVSQKTEIGGQSYEDRYESSNILLSLKDREIDRAETRTGGRFILHRPFGKGSPAVLGGAAGDPGRVEKFVGGCTGPSSYTLTSALMTGNAWIEQRVGQGENFRKIARFQADKIVARRGIGASRRMELLHARGEGSVRGSGEKWEVRCDLFEVDLVKHRSKVIGDPAEVVNAGLRQYVDEAYYDYERDEWELMRPRSGPR